MIGRNRAHPLVAEGSLEPSREPTSRPCGFGPLRGYGVARRRHSHSGLPLRGTDITAPNAGAILTGLATALAFGPDSFADVAIAALQAGASKLLPDPPLRVRAKPE